MELAKTLYVELNFVSAAILFIMLIYTMGIYYDFDKDTKRLFIKLVVCTIVALISDTVAFLIKGHEPYTMVVATHIFCIIYFTAHPLFGYYWLKFTLKRIRFDELSRRVNIIIIIPIVIAVIAVVTSPVTGYIYYLDEANLYVRGRYMAIIIAASFMYCAISTILVIKEIIKKLKARQKIEYFSMLLFPIPTALGCVIQMNFYGVSAIWVLSAISLLIAFISLQNYQITRDFLTGLYNRMRTEKLISREISLLPRADYILFVCMIDIDSFKSINDRFGHKYGDKALVDAATIIKSGCRKKDSVGRFGGDEFIVLGRAKTHDEVYKLKRNIINQTNIYNANSPVCPISFSIGCKLYDKNDRPSIDSIMCEADNKMYEDKGKRKGGDLFTY